jgi:hypothetical protein
VKALAWGGYRILVESWLFMKRWPCCVAKIAALHVTSATVICRCPLLAHQRQKTVVDRMPNDPDEALCNAAQSLWTVLGKC